MNLLLTDDRYFSWVGGTSMPYNATNAASLTNHYKGLSSSLRNAIYGYNMGDEPNTSQNVDYLNWTSYFKANDNTKMVFFNLLPVYGFSDRPTYEAYLDSYLNDPTSSKKPDVACFDYYPFRTPANGNVRTDYFYNISIVKKKAGTRPFWAFVQAAFQSLNGYYVDPNENHMRFTAFCPIAYGAKGILYYSYMAGATADFAEALYRNCTTKSVEGKYEAARTINWYIKNIVGPVVMNATSLGAFHKSTGPTNEQLPADEILNHFNAPLLDSIGDANVMAGIFRDKTMASTYYLLVVNKSLSTVGPVSITIRGDYRNKVSFAPSVVNYVGATTYNSASVTYDTQQNKSSVSLSLSGGEGRIIKITGVTNAIIPTMQMLFDQ